MHNQMLSFGKLKIHLMCIIFPYLLVVIYIPFPQSVAVFDDKILMYV